MAAKKDLKRRRHPFPTASPRSAEAVQTSGAALRVRLRQLYETRRKIPEALTARIDAQNRSFAHPRARPVPILFQNELRAMEFRTGSIYRRAVRRLDPQPRCRYPLCAAALPDVQSLGKL